MGANIFLRRKDRDTEVSIQFEIKNAAAYFDHIVEFAPIHMISGDSLTISWSGITLRAFVNGKLHDEKPFGVRGEFTMTEDKNVCFARLTYFKGESKVRVYETMPDVPGFE